MSLDERAVADFGLRLEQLGRVVGRERNGLFGGRRVTPKLQPILLRVTHSSDQNRNCVYMSPVGRPLRSVAAPMSGEAGRATIVGESLGHGEADRRRWLVQ